MVYGWYHGVPPEIWNSADFSSQDPFERALLERRMEDSSHAEVFFGDHAEFFLKCASRLNGKSWMRKSRWMRKLFDAEICFNSEGLGRDLI